MRMCMFPSEPFFYLIDHTDKTGLLACRYPGIACDIPSHSYQFTFENNPQWSSYYASGAKIQAYLQWVATKYDAYRPSRAERGVG